MAKVRINELQGDALDWTVAKFEGAKETAFISPTWVALTMTVKDEDDDEPYDIEMHLHELNYSSDEHLGGLIIDREKINHTKNQLGSWDAWIGDAKTSANMCSGPTKLIASMRCFAASKSQDGFIEIPDEFVSQFPTHIPRASERG
jgi:hypothetical protein